MLNLIVTKLISSNKVNLSRSNVVRDFGRKLLRKKPRDFLKYENSGSMSNLDENGLSATNCKCQHVLCSTIIAEMFKRM